MKRWMLLLPLLPLLSGCLQDTASYSLGERDQAITLVRNKVWFWKDTVDVEVIIARMPDCNGGGSIKEIEQASSMAFYQAPDEYPEPIFLLKTSAGVYALSAQSCRLQKFPQAPVELGRKIGEFKEVDGKFRFAEAGA